MWCGVGDVARSSVTRTVSPSRGPPRSFALRGGFGMIVPLVFRKSQTGSALKSSRSINAPSAELSDGETQFDVRHALLALRPVELDLVAGLKMQSHEIGASPGNTVCVPLEREDAIDRKCKRFRSVEPLWSSSPAHNDKPPSGSSPPEGGSRTRAAKLRSRFAGVVKARRMGWMSGELTPAGTLTLRRLRFVALLSGVENQRQLDHGREWDTTILDQPIKPSVERL